MAKALARLASSQVPAGTVLQAATGADSTSKSLENKTFGQLFTEYLQGEYSGGKSPTTPFVRQEAEQVKIEGANGQKSTGSTLLDDLNAATGTGKKETSVPLTNPTGSTVTMGSGSTGGIVKPSNEADKAYNEQISKSISDMEAKYGDLYSHIKETDYTEKPYYKTIMESYGIAGDDAADAESASGAGANGGNLDSYAAANARRQRLAFKNAGHSAALDAYNAEIGNLLNTLNSLGVNVNDLYATWSGDLSSQRENATNRYLGELESDTTKYVSDNELEGTKYVSDNELAGTKYVSDNNLAASKYAADTERYMAELASADNRYAIDANSADARYLAQLDVTMQESANELQKYLADLDYSSQALDREAAAKANEEANALTKYIADLEAETERYGVDKNAETQINIQNAKNALAMYESLLSGSGVGVEDAKEDTDQEKNEQKMPTIKKMPTIEEKLGAGVTLIRDGEAGLKNYLMDLPADVDMDAVMDAAYYLYGEYAKNTMSGSDTSTLSRNNSNKTATAVF